MKTHNHIYFLLPLAWLTHPHGIREMGRSDQAFRRENRLIIPAHREGSQGRMRLRANYRSLDAAVGEIRDFDYSKKPVPDSSFLHPGYLPTSMLFYY